MKEIALLYLALASGPSQEQSEAATHLATAPHCSESATIAYRPPTDLILKTAAALKEAAEIKSNPNTSPPRYDRDVVLIITVGEEGLVRDVVFYASSRNRRLDRAARNWAFGIMFTPIDCGDDETYEVRLPVSVSI